MRILGYIWSVLGPTLYLPLRLWYKLLGIGVSVRSGPVFATSSLVQTFGYCRSVLGPTLYLLFRLWYKLLGLRGQA